MKHFGEGHFSILSSCDESFFFLSLTPPIKGALDKYDIYLFISNSVEDFELNQYQNFQLILPMRFHFMMYFVNSIIPRVSHRLTVLCIYWSWLWKIEKK